MSNEDDPSSSRAGASKTFTNISLLNTQGGIRGTKKTPRGVYLAKDQTPAPESTLWLQHIENKLHYRFQNPDLLEEALETPGSGVVCVGQGCRLCEDGNKGLARIGEGAMRMVMEDVCYLARYHPRVFSLFPFLPFFRFLSQSELLTQWTRGYRTNYQKPNCPFESRHSRKGHRNRKVHTTESASEGESSEESHQEDAGELEWREQKESCCTGD